MPLTLPEALAQVADHKPGATECVLKQGHIASRDHAPSTCGVREPADALADYEAVIAARREAILRSAERKAAYLKPTPDLRGKLYSPHDLFEARMADIDAAFKRATTAEIRGALGETHPQNSNGKVA